jgi:Short C-terminal domain
VVLACGSLMPAATGEPQRPPNHAVGQLNVLGELRDSGVLTPEEFEAEKARIRHS